MVNSKYSVMEWRRKLDLPFWWGEKGRKEGRKFWSYARAARDSRLVACYWPAKILGVREREKREL